MDDNNQPQPTICSACGRTSGKCQSCIKADALISQHENATARVMLRGSLEAMVTGAMPAPDQGTTTP